MSTNDPRNAAKIAQFERLIADLIAEREAAPRGHRAKINRRLLSAQFLLAIYRNGYSDPDSRSSA